MKFPNYLCIHTTYIHRVTHRAILIIILELKHLAIYNVFMEVDCLKTFYFVVIIIISQ